MNNKITNSALLHICTHLVHLEKLNVSECSQISDEGFKQLLAAATDKNNNNSSVSGIRHSLRDLSVRECALITDTGIQHVAQNFPQMTIFDCVGVKEITDHSIEYLC